FLEKARQGSIRKQSSFRLTAGTVVRLVARVADSLNRSGAYRTRLSVTAVNGHALSKSGDFFRKPVAGALAEPIDPLEQSLASGVKQCQDLVVGKAARQPQRRNPRAMEDLIGVCVSDSAEQRRVS